MSEEKGSIGTYLLLFLAGAAVGAAVVALTTPKTGPELRTDLKDLGKRMKGLCCCSEECGPEES